MRSRKIKSKIIIVLCLFVLSTIGFSFAWFNYTKTGSMNRLITGSLYLSMNSGSDTINLTNVFPETKEEARSRDDNTLTFTVSGKNTSPDKSIEYEIYLDNGDNKDGKERFNSKDLVFDLIEVGENDEETIILDAVSYDEFNETKIWVDQVDKNTNEDIERTYKLRMWLSDDVVISDNDPNADYAATGENAFKNYYATVKVGVEGDLVDKILPLTVTTNDAFISNNYTYFVNDIENDEDVENVYKLNITSSNENVQFMYDASGNVITNISFENIIPTVKWLVDDELNNKINKIDNEIETTDSFEKEYRLAGGKKVTFNISLVPKNGQSGSTDLSFTLRKNGNIVQELVKHVKFGGIKYNVIYTDKSSVYTGEPISIDDIVIKNPDDSTYTGNYTSTFYSGDKCSGTPLVSAPISVGTYSQKIVVPSGPNAEETVVCGKITIARTTTTINISSTGGTYNGNPIPVEVDTELDTVIKYYTNNTCTTLIDANNETKVPVDAGEYYAKAVIADNQNYNYAESACTKHEIAPKSINAATLNDDNLVYDGEAKKPGVTVKDGDKTLVQGTDYDVVYTDNTDAGEATATITLKGNYTGTITKTFDIDKATINVPSSPASKEYTGASQNHGITIPTGVSIVETGSTLSATDVGTYKVIVKLDDPSNYKWNDNSVTNKEINWSIGSKTLGEEDATLDKTTYTYDGEAKEPGVTVKDGSKTLTPGTDYDVTYTDNTDAGTGTATITLKGNYTGTITKHFTIEKASVTVPESPSDKTYNGESQSHGVVIPTGASIVNTGSTLSATNAGDYKVILKISDTDNYKWSDDATGNKEVTWKIKPKGTSNITATLGYTSTTYDGTDKEPSVTVKDGNKTLTKGTDYDVVYTDNKNSGEATVTITMKGNYTGTITEHFTINKITVNVPATPADKDYTAGSQNHGVTIPTGASIVSTGSTLSATNVDVYKVILKLDDPSNYKWNDNSTSNKEISWKIVKSDTTTTLADINEDYTGEFIEASGATSKLNSNNSNITGATYTYTYYSNDTCTTVTTTPKNSGTYYVKAKLDSTNNYNSSTSACKKMVISSQGATLTLEDDEVSVVYSETISIPYTYNGDGTLSCASANAQYVTCSVDTVNHKINITGVKPTTDPIKITVNASAGTYFLATSATADVEVTKKNVTASISSCNNKAYDGNTTASCTLASLTGIASGDTVTAKLGTCTFNNKNVGTNKTVTCTGISLDGADKGNYSLTSTSATKTANITAKLLTATVSASDKEYDGGTSATCSTAVTLSGIVTGDTVTATASASGTFDNKNVGEDKTVTCSGITLAGADKDNYSVASSKTTTADINKKNVTASISSCSNKTYDGGTSASCTLAALTGIVSGETASAKLGTCTFDNKNVGTGKTVTCSGISLDGTDKGNYNLTSTTATKTANITAKSLTITADDKTMTYGNNAPSYSYTVRTSDLVSGETASVVTGTAKYTIKSGNDTVTVGSTTNAGEYTIVPSGLSASNYAITYVNGTLTINKANNPMSVTANQNWGTDFSTTSVDHAFTGASGAQGAVTYSIVSQKEGETTVNYFSIPTSGTPSIRMDANTPTGTYKVVIKVTAAGNSNYESETKEITLTISVGSSEATCPGTITGYEGTYDGNSHTITVSNDALGGTVEYRTATSGDGSTWTTTKPTRTNVGTTTVYVRVNGDSNHDDKDCGSKTIKINAKALTVTAKDQTVKYGTAITTGTGQVTVTGLVTGDSLDSVTLAQSKTAVSTDGKITPSAAVIKKGTETVTSNYSISYVQGDLIVEKKDVTASITSCSDKTYDGTNTASCTLSVSGKVGSETVTASGTCTFNNKNVGADKEITCTSLTLGGADKENYNLTITSLTGSADIAAKTLTITAKDQTVQYGTGITTGTSGVTVSGLVTGDSLDSVTLTQSKTAVSDDGKITPSAAVIKKDTETVTSNYNISYVQGDLTVEKKDVTASITSCSNKTYDGKTTASCTLSVSGKVGTETVTASGTCTFNNATAGNNKAVTCTSLTLGGTDKGNYNLTTTSLTGSANITKAALTVTADDKSMTYGGSAPTYTSKVTGFVNSETVSVLGGTLAYTIKDGSTTITVGSTTNVGEYTIVPSGYTSSNYEITYANGTLTINKANNPMSVTANQNWGTDFSTTSVDHAFTGASGAQGVVTYSIVSQKEGETTVNYFSIPTAGTPSIRMAANTPTGTYKVVIKVTAAGNSNYESETKEITLTISVGSSEATCPGTITGYEGTYDGNSHTITVSNDALGGTVEYRTATSGDGSTWTTSKPTRTNVGATTVYVRVNGDSNHDDKDCGSKTIKINAKELTATVSASDKEYDGGTSATCSTSVTLSGIVTGDTVTATANASGTFDNKNVGEDKTVTCTGITLGGADKDNYSVASSKTTTADINKKNVTASISSCSNKTYDGETSASCTLASLTGIVSGETASAKLGTCTFNNASAGNNKTVTCTGISLDGTNKGNYNLTSTSATKTANITAKELTATVSASDKEYDGGTSATCSTAVTLSGIVEGDTVTATANASGTFDNKNVGEGKTVTCSGITLAGEDKANYTVASSKTTTADINKKNVTASISSCSNKTYDGNTTASCTLASLTGIVSGETASAKLGTCTFNNATAGNNKTVTCTGISLDGTNKGNYNLTSTTATKTANITKAPLTVTADDKSMEYGGTAPAFTSTVTGFVNSETVSVLGGTLAHVVKSGSTTITVGSTTNKGEYTIVPSGYTSSNYEITYVNGTLTISEGEAICPTTFTAYSGTYDGESHTITATGYSGGTIEYRTAESGDGSTWTTTKPTRTNVGETTVYVRVNGDSNHTTKNCGNKTITITTKALTVTAKDQTVKYGTEIKTDTGQVTVTGLVTGDSLDSVTLTQSKTAVSDDGKITPSAAVIKKDTETVTSNYNISYVQGDLTVEKKDVTASITSCSDKTYDGTNTASCTLSVSGKVGNETVTASGTCTFNNKNAGADKVVTCTSLTLGGTDKGNYNLTTTSLTGSADITAKTLTAAVTASNKVYDGGTSATCGTTATLTGVETGDTVTASVNASGAFDNKNVGTGKTVTCSGITLTGTDKGNYSVASSKTTTANITAKEVTVTADNKSMTYGCTIPTYGYTVTGAVGSETAVSGTAKYTIKSGSTNVTVGTSTAVGSYTIVPSGLTAGSNYSIKYANGTLTINKDNTVTELDDQSFNYTGSAQTPTGVSSKLSCSDSTISGGSYTYTYYGNKTCTGEALTSAPTGVGEYGVKATLAGTSNYNSSTSSCAEYVINNETLTGGSVTITGTNTWGETLTATITDTTPAATYTCEWFSNTTNSTTGGTSLGTATVSSKKCTYEIPSSQVGKYIYVVIKANKEGYSEKQLKDITDATANTTATVAKQAATNSVAISGENTFGKTLTATITTNSNGTKSYQWYSNTENSTTGGTAISGATSSTLTLTSDLVGKYIYVKGSVAESDIYKAATDAYDITDSSANETATVKKEDFTGGSVAITGTNTWGETLTATITDTTPAATYTCEWFANSSNSTTGGTSLGTATVSSKKCTYEIPKEQVGKYIYVVVTASKTGYNNKELKDITDATANTTATVAKQNLSVTATAYTGTYDGANHGASIKVTSANWDGKTIVSGTSTSYGTNVTTTGAVNTSYEIKPTYKDWTNGAKTVYYKVTGGTYYKDATGTSTVTVDKKALTTSQITAYSTEWVDGASTYTRSISTGVGNETVTLTYTPSANAVGEYTYATTAGSGKYTLSQSNTNYSISSAGEFEIVEKLATCPKTITAYEGTYDGNSHTITVSNDAIGGTVEYSEDGTNWSTTKPTRTNVGTTTVYVRVNGDSNHTTAPCGSKTIKVNAKALTVTAKDQTVKYGTAITTGTGQVTVSGLVTGDSLSSVTLTQSKTAVSTDGKITPSAAVIKKGTETVTSNYIISYVQGDLTVEKKDVTASITSCSDKTYDGTNTANCILSVSGKVGNETVTASGTCTFNNKNVGADKGVTCTSLTLGGTDKGNYNLTTTSLTGSADITTKAITITAKAQTITYGGSIATGTSQVTVATLATGDSLTAITLAPSTTEPTTNGTITPSAATIKDSNGSGTAVTSNYSITYNTGKLVIEDKTLTPSINSCTNKTYDGTTSVTCTISLATIETGDTVTATGTCTAADKNVGTGKTVSCTNITLAGADKDKYSLSSTSASKNSAVNITAKAITITAKAQTITYGNDIATGVSQVTVATLATGDSLTGITLTPSTSDYTTSGTITPSAATIKDSNGSGTAVTSNYSITYNTGKLTINKKSLTPSINTCTNREYNGTTTVNCTISLATVETGDTVTASGTCTAADKNVGTGKTVSCTNITLAGADAGNYSLSSTSASKNSAVNITAKSLTAGTPSCENKVYDGSADAECTVSYTNVVEGDTVNAGATCAFADAKPGTNKTVTCSSFTKSGADSGNYTVPSGSKTTTANINKKNVTASISSCSNKTYDGKTNASCTLASLTGIVSGETASAKLGTCTFNNATAGNNKTVTCTGISLDGEDAGNYNLTSTSATKTANITKAALTVTANDKSMEYGGTAPTYTSTVTGFVNSETVSVLGGTLTYTIKSGSTTITVGSTTNKGEYTIVPSGYTSSNYAITYVNGTLTISEKLAECPKTITAYSGIYDRNSHTITVSNDAVGGTVEYRTATSGDGSTWSTTKPTRTDAGETTVYVRVNGDSNHTTATCGSKTIEIDTKPLTATVSASDKEYDGGTSATCSTAVTLSGIVTGDTVTATANASGTFDNKNVGEDKTVTCSGITLAGADKDNYSVASSKTTTANINKKNVTASISSCSNKTYDGETSASCTLASLTGIVSGETASAKLGTCTFNNKNVGTGKTVTCTGISLDGTDKGNYNLTSTSATKTANITAKSITITAKAQTITYGNDIATGVGQVTVATLATGDSLTAITLAPSTTEPTTTGTITPSAATIKDSNGSGTAVTSNYSITYKTGTLTINKKSLTPSINSCTNKTYDGTTSVTCTISLATIETGDTVTASGTCTAADKNVGTGKNVSCTNIKLAGDDAGKYSLSSTSASKNSAVNITAKVITITAKAQTITYGESIATGTSQVTVATLVSGDSLTAITLAPSTTEPTTTGTITPSAATIKDSNGSGTAVTSNYSITYNTGKLVIEDKTLTPSINSCTNKTYDGTSSVTCTISLATIETGDSVTASGTCTAADKNVGTGKTVSCTNITLAGADKDKYSLSSTSASKNSAVNITAKAITITAKAQTITYGGSIATGVGQVTVATLASGDSLTAITLAPSTTEPTTNGTITPSAATIKDSNGSGTAVTSNYSITYKTGTLTINKKSLTPSVNSCTNKTYDGTTSVTCTISLATIETGDTVTASGTCTAADKNAGTGKNVSCTNITLAGADKDKYSLSSTSSSKNSAVNITKAALTVTADDKSMTYGSSAPTYTSTVTGFVNSETVSVLGGTLAHTVKSGSTTITVGSTTTAGSYTIVPSGYTSSNYEITYVNGTLTIEQNSTCQMSVADPVSKHPGDEYDLSSLVSGATGTVTYALKSGGSNTTTASTLTGSKLTIGAMSTANDNNQSIDVTITDSGSGNYAGCSINKTITAVKQDNTMTAKAGTVYVSSTTALSTFIQNNIGGALSASITTDNEGGTKGSISSTNFVAGTLAANDDANKTVVLSITAARTATVKQKTVSSTVTVQKYTRALNLTVNPTTVGYGETASLSTINGGSGGTPGTSITYASSNTSVFTVSGNTLTAVAPSGTSSITATRAGSQTVKAATSSAVVATASKGTCNPPSNVTIGTDKKVSWTASSNATSYQVCVATGTATCTPSTTLTSGSVYDAITNETGTRKVYVHSVCNSTNYNTPSASVNGSTTVYSVTLTAGTGISAVTGAGNYITGANAEIDATVSDGYTWANWTGTSTIPEKSTSITVDGNKSYTANATGNKYTATFYYNGTNGITSTTAECTVSSGNNCQVDIPSAVKSSKGTHDNEYYGLSESTGNMTAAVAKSATTVSLTGNKSYYALYSSAVTIHYPTSTSAKNSTTAYRNQWLTSTSAMATTVLATTATGTTSNYSFSSSVSGYSLYGFATSASTNTRTYNDVAALKASNATTVYAILSKSVTATFKYSSSAAGEVASTTASANKYIRCTSSAAEISNSTLSPSITETAPTGTIALGWASASNSMSTVASITTENEDVTYYRVYSQALTIYYPTSTTVVTSVNDKIYRNSLMTGNSASTYTTRIVSGLTGTTQLTNANVTTTILPNMAGSFTGLATTYNTITKYDINNSSNVVNNATTTYYVVNTINENVSVTFYYSSSNVGAKTSSIVNGTRTKNLYCSSTSEATTSLISEGSITPPSTTLPYGTSLVGWATSASTMTTTDVINTLHTSYYAVYRGNVTNYYYDSNAYTSRTLYRNGVYGTATSYSMYLSTTNTGLTNYTAAGGPGSGWISDWIGLSTAADTTAEYSTVAAAAKSNATNLYTVYQFIVNYTKGANVSSIASTIGGCYMSATGANTGDTSCSVTLPAITANTGYLAVGWNTTIGATTGMAPGTQYTLSKNETMLIANAIEVWAENLSYDNTDTSLACTDSQCALDKLSRMFGVQLPKASETIGNLSELEQVGGAKRYVGANPDNYVNFNCDGDTCETWRIVGVYGNNLKIIRDDLITTQQYNSSTTTVAWEGSSLETYLNQDTTGGYYYSLTDSAKEMIVNGTWDVEAATTTDDASNAQLKASATQLTNKKVGLLSSYEYLYAAGDACYETGGNYYNSGEETCASANWLLPVLTGGYASPSWFMNPSTADTTNALIVNTTGVVEQSSVDSTTNAFVPVVYLNQDVVITDGSGTVLDPYQLSYEAS